MKLKQLFVAALLMGCAKAHAQSFAINTTGATADNSAILDITSTSKGVLVPRVSTAQRNAIAAPAKGLMVYDSTVNQFAYYDGAAWLLLNANANTWTVSGSHQYSAVSGNVGIGTNAPAGKLHVKGNVRLDSARLSFVNTGNSVFIGDNAGINDDLTDNRNVFVGFNAGKQNTTGNLNTFLGSTAGESNTTGAGNVAIGSVAMLFNTAGNNNVALGTNALSANSTGNANIAIGTQALFNSSNVSNNIAMGFNTLYNHTSGSNNIAIGNTAGANNATGSGNIFIGNSVGANELGSNKLYIDNSNTSSPLIYGNFASDSLKVNGSLTINNAYTLPTSAGTANQVLQTNGAGQANWVSPTSLSITETDPQVSAATANYIPKWNGTTLIDGQVFDDGTNVGLGTAAPSDKLHVVGNLRVENGKIPLVNNSNSVYIGNNSGTGDNLAAVLGNTAIGTNSMVANTSGFSNTAVGYEAMRLNNVSGGAENTAIGAWAFRNNSSGVENTVLGSGAGMNNISGSRNTFIGRFAGRYNLGGNNVFLGYQAGLNETGSDKLYISNSSTIAPLIYGDFANHLVKVNGTLNVNDAYNLPTTTGTANQVLQTNGAGNTNWVNASALAITETDPQVSSATANKIPKWNGTALTDGLITDNGTNIGIGTTAPTAKLQVRGITAIDSGRIEFFNTGNSIFIGKDAGLVDDRTTNDNVFIGFLSGVQSVSGVSNVGIGGSTLTFIENNSNNTAIGAGALQSSLGNNNTAIGRSAGAFSDFGSNNVFIGYNAGAWETGSNKLYIDNSNTSAPLIYGDFASDVLSVNGSLGIGTTSTTQAKLVVSGYNLYSVGNFGQFKSDGTGSTNSTGTPYAYSIYASNRIAASEFNAFSDARIKNIQRISNSKNDLQTLMAIEITDYKLKDSIGKGNREFKKVIAQQVEKVYPLAVSQMTDVIPDIYQAADMKNGTVQLPNTLQAGDKVKLIFASGEEMATVTAATATSFSVDKKQTGQVFVYGREVSDFRSVDYEAIGMLHVSATQQLVKEMEQQKVQINQQQQQINQLITELKKLKQSLPVSSGGAL